MILLPWNASKLRKAAARGRRRGLQTQGLRRLAKKRKPEDRAP